MSLPSETPVLVVGGGPSGLILALQLACHGIKCTLVERNESTTKWPKMDITNVRSMELFNRLDVSDGLKGIGVPPEYSFDVLFSTGLSKGGELITKWDLPSPKEWATRIHEKNDGSMPRETYRRCSQAIFEAWLKPRVQQEELIDAHFGIKFESLKETPDGVVSQLVNVETGERYTIKSDFVAGCDGAGSRVRKAIGVELIGGPVPGAMMLVHFKSRDLTTLHRQGQFWHIFFTSGAVIISQDEVDTWTTHLPIPLGADWQSIDPKEAIYKVLGGSLEPCPINVDEVMVKSVWRPNICIADRYISEHKRVYLSGDAAHQNIPTGGYGMNTAVGDSFDLGWKLAARLKGFGGPHLLASYESERKPVAVRNIERSGVHHSVHAHYIGMVSGSAAGTITSQESQGHNLREAIKSHVLKHDGENQDHGIEMGYRYNGSGVILTDPDAKEPEWSVRTYVPSTWPGARAPHVFLRDGSTSIYDLFGRDYTIVDFSETGSMSDRFVQVAEMLHIPLKRLHLPHEEHAASIWERQVVLIRPDDHVAWRSPVDTTSNVDIEHILLAATGNVLSKGSEKDAQPDVLDSIRVKGFSGTVGIRDQTTIEMLGAFQK